MPVPGKSRMSWWDWEARVVPASGAQLSSSSHRHGGHLPGQRGLAAIPQSHQQQHPEVEIPRRGLSRSLCVGTEGSMRYKAMLSWLQWS